MFGTLFRPIAESIGYMATSVTSCDRELHMNALLGDLITNPFDRF